MSVLEWIVLPGLFLLIAAVYSSVGLGGGSSYLAVLSVFLVDFYAIRTQALLCNLAVVAVGCWLAWRHGSLRLRTAWPYVLLSVPAALLGAMVKLEERTFFLTLGGALIVSAAFLFFRTNREHSAGSNSSRLPAAIGLGGGIGFFSGLVGIGGGIFLAPILHLLRWETARH
ncbi:MAG: sulfite exporter TauE/SafE family protein, partial [Bacteroidota bacterium]